MERSKLVTNGALCKRFPTPYTCVASGGAGINDIKTTCSAAPSAATRKTEFMPVVATSTPPRSGNTYAGAVRALK